MPSRRLGNRHTYRIEGPSRPTAVRRGAPPHHCRPPLQYSSGVSGARRHDVLRETAFNSKVILPKWLKFPLGKASKTCLCCNTKRPRCRRPFCACTALVSLRPYGAAAVHQRPERHAPFGILFAEVPPCTHSNGNDRLPSPADNRSPMPGSIASRRDRGLASHGVVRRRSLSLRPRPWALHKAMENAPCEICVGGVLPMLTRGGLGTIARGMWAQSCTPVYMTLELRLFEHW